jgi:hypothetical protein
MISCRQSFAVFRRDTLAFVLKIIDIRRMREERDAADYVCHAPIIYLLAVATK